MTTPSSWYAGNDAALAAAMHWLRLKLQWLAEQQTSDTSAAPEPASPVPSPPAPERERPTLWRRNSPPPAAPSITPLAHPSSARLTEEDLREAAQQMEATVNALNPPPALKTLAERLGLSTFEQQVLLLCAGMEFDTRMAALCQQASGRPYPTFALTLALFDHPTWDVLSPERPLRYWRLLEINQPAGQPLTTAPLRADERIVNALKGLNYLDDRLSSLMTPRQPVPMPLPSSQAKLVTLAQDYLHAHQNDPRWPLLQLVGRGRTLSDMAEQVAAQLRWPLYQLTPEALPTTPQELENLARLWHRESLLAPTLLYLDATDLEASNLQRAAVLRFLNRTDGVILLGTHDPWPDLPRTSLMLEPQKPTRAEQEALWSSSLGGIGGMIPAHLAAQFNLSPQEIRQAAQDATDDEGDTRLLEERLWDNCRAFSRPHLDTLAQPIEVKADWSRLILPAQEEEALRQIVAQARHRQQVYQDWGFADSMNRGLGISALFTGESGTGKTLAAEVLAHELRLDLYRIDLASVVSKYIGETEKNLRQLFDAAEDGGAILFFDEADALFGKRSEVKDAHDRYANIEVNYLLQRMEAFSGLTILATNLKSALDNAFTRRLRFIVNFPFPSAQDRERLWRVAFPARAQVGELDYARLGKLNLTGANIHNAALSAAFLAARSGKAIEMPEVLQAARNEYRKLERPISEADFVWKAHPLTA